MTILDNIIRYKLEEVAAAKTETTLSALEDAARSAPSPRGFLSALREKAETGFALIAEIKKASPSKGLIRKDFQPDQLASAYEAGGAACLSVLTDTPSFQGHPDFLRTARKATTLPVLRKDFMIDPYQVVEARAWGADCILLIMACLSDAQANELETAAIQYGMDVLVECHDRDELDRALNLKSKLIGVNNRNLKTFSTSLDNTLELAKHIPSDVFLISESGISQNEDLAVLKTGGAKGFLVGESLMRQSDVTEATRELLTGKQSLQA